MYFHTDKLLILLAYVVKYALTLNLDGSPLSYVMYPPWQPCLNASLSFKFKTEEAHSLILYLEQWEDFLEVQLFKGSVRLRTNIGDSDVIIQAGNSLNDNKWHTVDVSQHSGLTFLKVDGVENSQRSTNAWQNHGLEFSSDSFLVLGGLPIEYESQKLTSLALPSVIFEPRFRGSIRNFFYGNCKGELIRPVPLELSGVLTKNTDLCESGNPCLNGGRCLTTDNGLLCECSHTDYKGDICELQKVSSEATFQGSQYLFYNLSNKGGITSEQDQILLDFRTKQASSLLFHTGNSKDYITAGLLNGGVFLSVKLVSGIYETEIRPIHKRFDDSRWHHLVILRMANEVSIELDDIYKDEGIIPGRFVKLSSNVLYVAGSPHADSLPTSKTRPNFKGCLRNVRYQADSIKLDLIELARTKHSLLQVIGDVTYGQCPHEIAQTQPVTFTTRKSYLTLPNWQRTSLGASLAFKFRTIEPEGLMMYSKGNSDNIDIFALELFGGHLYLLLDMGSGIEKIQASNMSVTDGNTHDVHFEFSESSTYISVDEHKKQISPFKISDKFDVDGQLYVGGLGPEMNVTDLSSELWTSSSGLYFVGCLQDMVLNGHQVDLVEAATLQNMSDVKGDCRQLESQCLSSPCNHQGKCIEGWGRFICDCRATGFVGSVCQTAAVTLRFDGSQFMKVSMAPGLITQVDDISLRFQTMQPNGILFLSTGHMGSSMELYLEGGVLFLSTNLGRGAKILSVGHMLNDNFWHTAFIKRRMQIIEVTIDQERSVTAVLPGKGKELSHLSVVIGQLAQPDQGTAAHHTGFDGNMQAIIFNGNDFLKMAKSDGRKNIETSAHFSPDEYYTQKSVTFKSGDAYAVLPQLQVHDTFSLNFQLKTTESSGLILYNGGAGQDFFAIEIFQGFLFYIYDIGVGPHYVKANANGPINDNKWHEIQLLRPEMHKQLLRVDNNTPTIDYLTSATHSKFDLSGHLYIGGVSKKMYHYLPRHIYSKQGFVGCLGALDLNGHLPDLIRDANQVHGSVQYGCQGPSTSCRTDSCANNGRCVQYWTSNKCDCDMTSFTGPTCKDESVSYKFGPLPGYIIFVYPDDMQPSTIFDNLAFGFKTFKDEATLIRIDSKSYDDFIQLELLRGHVHLTYNMGSIIHRLASNYQRVNDGQYHVVHFTRTGPNATLQIDSHPPQVNNYTGYQNQIFNNQAVVTVGGKKANGSIIEHFEGLISGLAFNGVHLLELAKQNDPNIHFEGYVFLNEKTKHTRSKDPSVHEDISDMQATEEDTWVEEDGTDDIIFVGPGSSCQYDEQDCSTITSGSDEIITAVVIIKMTTTLPTVTTIKQEPGCTDQDCETSLKLPGMTPPASHHNEDGHPIGGENSDIYSSQHKIHDDLINYDSTQEPGKALNKNNETEHKEINLAVILGISGSILVAIIILGIALCKLRGRNEGIYKVDETQNFSSLESRKSVGNGIIASESEPGTCNRGRMKDVKEWYV